jgi:hypothetical protein
MRHAVLLLAVIAGAPGLVISTPASAAGSVHAAQSSNLTVRLYDYAGIPDPTLFRAIDEIKQVFRRAGIGLRLVRCRVALTDPILHPCHTEPTGPAVVQVRILPEKMAALAKLDKRVFGFAMTATRPGYGVIASVFYGRVQRLAADFDYRGYDAGVVLGYVVAHEAGHLLLGDGRHSKRGIMHIPWEEAELFSAHTGELVFTRDQAARIRRDVEARIRAQRANDMPEELLVGAPSEDSRPSGG